MENSDYGKISYSLEDRKQKPTVKNGTYRIIKWRTIDKAIDNTNHILFHSGSVSNDSFSERLLIAFNISMVTNMDKDIVVALRDIQFVNMSHPICGKSREHE